MLKLIAKLKTSGNALKYTANVIFLIISCLLISNLLIQLSDETFIKVIFVIVAVGLDIFRQYVVAIAKFYWQSDKFKSFWLWLVYLIHVSVVLLASVGFSLMAIDSKVKNTEVYNMERDSIISNIKSNEEEIKSLELTRNTLNNYEKRFRDLSQRIDSLQRRNNELYGTLKNFSEVKINIQKGVYDTLGETLHISGNILKLYMLLVISFLIELCLLLTSWTIKIKDDSINENYIPIATPGKDYIISNRDKILRYIDSLINADNQRLTGNPIIAEQTGIELKECEKIRELLSKTMINDTPLIYSSQGYTRANFTKSEIKSAILKVA